MDLCKEYFSVEPAFYSGPWTSGKVSVERHKLKGIGMMLWNKPTWLMKH